MFMKKLLLLFLSLEFAAFSFAQNSEIESITIGANFFRKEVIPNPIIRQVIGGTVIQVEYVGDIWEQNLERKNAFEYACRIMEEQLPDALPISVSVSFESLRDRNALTRTKILNLPIDSWVVPRTVAKRKMLAQYKNYDYTKDILNDPDGEIVFSDKDIFSYSMDYVDTDKYDLVTVALRELCKIMGFTFSIIGDNVNKQLKMDADKTLLPYDELAIGYRTSAKESYIYATSGNATICGYGLYSPPLFENMRSLSYFKVDDSNDETKLMQPDLPRGTSNRYVGKWLGVILEKIGWHRDIAVGGGGGSGTATATSTDKVEEYGKNLSFKMPGNNRSTCLPLVANLLNLKSNSKILGDELYEYIEQFSTYPVLNIRPDYPLLGWSISILCKDGTWDVISKYDILYPEIQFSTSEIDPVRALNYIRSSDGYLRCKLVRADWTIYGEKLMPGINTFARYFLLDYLPQKPEMAFSKVMPQTRTVADDYYADVKIGFKNVEGTEKILVEQLEEGSPVPFTYYVEDVRDGYFIASVDKEYSTTFKLRAMNKYGETVSEQLIVAPLVPATYTLNSQVNGDLLSLKLEKGRKRSLDDRALIDYRVLDLNHSMIVREGKVDNNIIDISSLEKGMYGLQVSDTEGRSYDTKFVR